MSPTNAVTMLASSWGKATQAIALSPVPKATALRFPRRSAKPATKPSPLNSATPITAEAAPSASTFNPNAPSSHAPNTMFTTSLARLTRIPKVNPAMAERLRRIKFSPPAHEELGRRGCSSAGSTAHSSPAAPNPSAASHGNGAVHPRAAIAQPASGTPRQTAPRIVYMLSEVGLHCRIEEHFSQRGQHHAYYQDWKEWPYGYQ